MSLLSNALNLVFRTVSTQKNCLEISYKCTKISRYRYISTKSRTNRTLKGMFKVGLAGVTVGAVVGTGYSIRYMNQPRAHILNEETFIGPVETVPKFIASKSVSCHVFEMVFEDYNNDTSCSY